MWWIAVYRYNEVQMEFGVNVLTGQVFYFAMDYVTFLGQEGVVDSLVMARDKLYTWYQNQQQIRNELLLAAFPHAMIQWSIVRIAENQEHD